MGGGYHPPPELVASWPKPNYIDPQTRGNELLIVVIFFLILTILIVSLRLWTRLCLQHNAGLDDLLIALSLIPNVGLAGLLILTETKFRWYRHIWDVPPEQVSGRLKLSWNIKLLFVLSSGLAKVSILALYKRVINGVANRIFKIVVNGAIVIDILYIVGFVLLLLLQCRPIRANWAQFSYPHPYTEKFHCVNEGLGLIINAWISVATDFMTAALPMFVFWQLHLPRREKRGLYLLFGIGFIVCIIGTARAVLGYHMLFKSYDVPWLAQPSWCLGYAENALLIICASIPPLNALINRVIGRSSQLFSSTKLGTGSSCSRLRPNTNIACTSKAVTGSHWSHDDIEEAPEFRMLQMSSQHRQGRVLHGSQSGSSDLEKKETKGSTKVVSIIQYQGQV